MKPKRKFSQEQKLKIVKLVLDDNLTVKQVTTLHDLDRQTVHRWINEYKTFGEKAFIDNSFVTQQQELLKLKHKVKELEEENAILKKVHAYFATQKRK